MLGAAVSLNTPEIVCVVRQPKAPSIAACLYSTSQTCCITAGSEYRVLFQDCQCLKKTTCRVLLSGLLDLDHMIVNGIAAGQHACIARQCTYARSAATVQFEARSVLLQVVDDASVSVVLTGVRANIC